MLKVITFSVTAGRDVLEGVVGESCPPHADPIAAQTASTTAEIRTSTSGANPLPDDKDEQAGRLQYCSAVPLVDELLDATVLICTYNRAHLLGETLDSLRATRTSLRWEVIVVDNNSADGTREAVTSRIAEFPVRLRYLFEPRQGKSNALNTGLEATDAGIVVFTDDDVRVGEEWLEASCRPMLDDPTIDYTGGPVLPIWERPRPSWLDSTRSDLWGTLAILDYGPDRFVFEERRRVPLGANMAVRRQLIDRIGGFDPSLGRNGNSLLGQEQAEFFCRSRIVGARGVYVPQASLQHHVPARRLTREYFLRWWYWKGVSKARLEQRHPVTEMGIDLSRVPTIARVPRFMVGSAVRDLGGIVLAALTANRVEAMRRAAMLCYFAGYVMGVRSAPAPPSRSVSPKSSVA